jgi:hypothetical protein
MSATYRMQSKATPSKLNSRKPKAISDFGTKVAEEQGDQMSL